MRRTVLILATLSLWAAADEETSQYEVGEHVLLWLNKIGPYHNPHETYSYYHLPFCVPDHIEDQAKHKIPHLGEVLEGNTYTNGGMHIEFAHDNQETVICSQTLTAKTVKEFEYAIENHYWYQLYLDHLPLWGMVGEVISPNQENAAAVKENGAKAFIYTHKSMAITYNGDRVIHVTLTSDNPVLLIEGQKIEFSYSVTWTPTTEKFEDRFNRYLDGDFFEHQIHWFAIFNSFMMVIFLCGLVALILIRTLKSDYAKYNIDESELPSLGNAGYDDSGWKQVHGDVFRTPKYLSLYCALVGTGAQLVVTAGTVISIAMSGALYVNNGAITKAWVICYVGTSIVNGFIGGGLYKQLANESKSEGWKQAMLLSAALFPGLVGAISFGINCVAIYYATITAIPVSTMLILIVSWALLVLPLVVGGTIMGRSFYGAADFPCRVNSLPRPEEPTKWFLSPAFVIAMTGVLPFGSIFIEMYFIFTSFWNYKFYYVYGFMLLVYIILIIVSLCVTTVATYFILNSENWHWMWISFLASGSTSAYVFLYSIYYFFMKTSMTGLLQTCFYFGYMLMFSIGFFMLCGTIGFYGSYIFVKRIYRNIKTD